MSSNKSDSISEDVEHEKKSKRKQDQMAADDRASSESEDDSSEDEQEDNGEDGSGSESDSIGEDGEDDSSLEKQKGQVTTQDNDTKKTTESPIIPKGLISNVIETPKNQLMEIQPSSHVKVANRNLFKKKFSFEDEEKILQVLLKENDTRGCLSLWKKLKDSMQFSIPVNAHQLYEKSRRLRERYFKQVKSGNPPTDGQEQRLYVLSQQIWGEEAVEKDIEKQPLALEQSQELKKAKKGKEKETTLDDIMDYERKYEKFLMEVGMWRDGGFSVATVLDVVGASKRLKLEKKWEVMHAHNVKTHMRNIKLIAETLKAVMPQPSCSKN